LKAEGGEGDDKSCFIYTFQWRG